MIQRLIFIFIWLTSVWSLDLSFNTIVPPDIDYNDFQDRLMILGSFDSISFYEYEGQSDVSSGDNLYLINNNDQFRSIHLYNGSITHMEKLSNNTILMIGSFQIDNYSSPVIFNVDDNSFTEISGWDEHVTGDIISVFYDEDQDLIYFGGDLSYDDEVYGLVIYNLSRDEFVDSPFRGFNQDSSVNSILKIADSNDDGSLIFAGHFNSLGDVNLLRHSYSNHTIIHHNHTTNISNTSIVVDPENVVSLRYAQISSVNTDSSNSDDPALIICPENRANWILNGQSVGSWSASLPFQVYPSKVRLFNSLRENSGVEYFRIITSPTNGIMNMSYVNPVTHATSYCDAWCPLLNVTYLETLVDDLDSDFYSINSTLTTGTVGFASTYQEFEFVNSVDVSSITVQVMSSYGNEAGLSGFQIYQSGIITYANDTLNEPNCASGEASTAAASLEGGLSWSTYNDLAGSHLTTTVEASEISNDVGVVFYPNVSYSGNYSVLLFTPGCSYDNTCASRGIVNVTLINGNGDYLTSTEIYQNNNEEKYDTIYTGHLDVDDGLPRVQMLLQSAIGEGSGEVTLVADRIQLNLLSVDQTYYFNNTNTTTERNSSSSFPIQLNGLFEYSLANFSSFDNSVSNVSTNGSTNVFVGNSTINLIGSQLLSADSTVNSLALINETLYIAGEFESPYGDNFIGVSLGDYNQTSNSTGVRSERVIAGGVNGQINNLIDLDGSLILLGEFNRTLNTTRITDLNSTLSSSTTISNIALYDGEWHSFMNGSNSTFTTLTNLTFHGIEYLILDGDTGDSQVWDNVNQYWVSNVDLNISQALSFSNFTLASGRMSYMELTDANGGATVSDPQLSPLPFELSDGNNSYHTALYVNRDVTIFGGQFTTSNGLQNLIYFNRTSGQIRGVDYNWDNNSSVVSLFESEGTVFLGMENGVTIGDDHIGGLALSRLNGSSISQPPSLSNTNGTVRVNSITGDADLLFVGGEFTRAGSVSCSGFCSYSSRNSTWSNPLANHSFAGVVYQMQLYSSNQMLISGSLQVDGESHSFASFDLNRNTLDVDLALNSGMTETIKKFVLANSNTIDQRVIALGDNYLGYFNGSGWSTLSQDLDMTLTNFTDMQLVLLLSDNSDNDEQIFDRDQVLMVSGTLSHQVYGNFSTGFYNGTGWVPYLFTGSGAGVQTALQSKPVETPQIILSLRASVMKVRNVVGVSFACALCSLLIPILAYCAYYLLIGKHKFNNQPMELRVAEKDMLQTVPPNQLLNSLDHAKHMAE